MAVAVEARRIRADEGERLRGVRLAALADAPGSFWQTLAEERVRPPQDWLARARRAAAGEAHATFLVERVVGQDVEQVVGRDVELDVEQDKDLLGMVDVHQPERAPEFRELAAMWVAPSLRGTGAADALLTAAVDWSRSVGAIGVRLWVVPTNPAAVRVYARHGFEIVGDPVPETDDPTVKVYVPMVLGLDPREAAMDTFLTRALAPWTDESG